MALDLSILTKFGAILSELLGKVQGEVPAIVDKVTAIGAQGQDLFETLKANFDDLSKGFGGKMSDAETKAALDAGIVRLKADMDSVDADPKTGQA